MEIWEVLGIAPTADKKQIKKAYAARARTVHPEEKPEEFRKLYGAYQAALKLAELPMAGKSYRTEAAVITRKEEQEEARREEQEKAQWEEQEKARREEQWEEQEKARQEEQWEQQEMVQAGGSEETEEGKPGMTQEEWEELCSYFVEIKGEQAEKIAFFQEKWKRIGFEYWKPEVKEWWKNYLKSEDFREIQWHPQLLEFLTQEVEKPLQCEYEIRMFFWEAYGFQEEDSLCKGDLQKLKRVLSPAYERMCREQKSRWGEEHRRATRQKEKKFYNIIFLIAVAIWCFFMVVSAILSKTVVEDYDGEGQHNTRSRGEQYERDNGDMDNAQEESEEETKWQ